MADDFVVGNMQFYQRNGEWVIKPINNNGVQEIIQSLIDEIERLRAERDAERVLADQLADELTECWSFAREYAHSGQTPPPSLAAHEEARRG